jgi:hypothetical protein
MLEFCWVLYGTFTTHLQQHQLLPTSNEIECVILFHAATLSSDYIPMVIVDKKRLSIQWQLAERDEGVIHFYTTHLSSLSVMVCSFALTIERVLLVFSFLGGLCEQSAI